MGAGAQRPKHPVLDKDVGELTEGIPLLDHVNPGVVDDGARDAFAAARRLLTFERHLDVLEREKGSVGALPQHVEQRAADGARRAHGDARRFARAALSAMNEMQRSGAWKQAVPVLADEMADAGTIKARELVDRLRTPGFAGMLRERGMPPEVLEWGLTQVDIDEVGLRSSGDDLIAEARGHTSVLAAENAQPVPLFDPDEFVDGGLYRRFKPTPGSSDPVSPYAAGVALLSHLLRRTEERAHHTSLHGVRVLSTGVDLMLVAAVVLTIIWLGAGTVVLFCRWGWIRDRATCQAAAIIVGVGIVVVFCMWAVLSGALSEGCWGHWEVN
jgi:hypothetical protein